MAPDAFLVYCGGGLLSLFSRGGQPSFHKLNPDEVNFF